MRKKSKTNKVLRTAFAISICIVMLFLCIQDSAAYSVYDKGSNAVDFRENSCYMNININGGPNGNSSVKIYFWRDPSWTQPTYSQMMNDYWWFNMKMTGTNNHNIRLVGNQTRTYLDSVGAYCVLPFQIQYDMPAHYQYTNWSSDAPDGMRLNFETYTQYDDGTNTASSTGYHSSSTTTRTMSVQANTGNVGLRTYAKKYYYNTSLNLNIAKATRTVTQHSWYPGGYFSSNQTNITDGNWFTPYSITPPSGYHLRGSFNYYNSSWGHLGSGTVNYNGFTVCDNNIVEVYYDANTYYVYYDANGGSGAPPTQAFLYNSGSSISWATPTRTGYTFAGWDYSGNHFNPGQAIPSGWGSFTLTAKWNVNYYYLDVNGWLDGVSNGGLLDFGTFDVYINGNLAANDVTDYYTAHPYGSRYEIKDIRATTGHKYKGVHSGSLTGTIGGNVSTFLSFITTTPPVITSPVITSPDQNEILPFISEGKLVIQLGDTFNAIKYATAIDAEDGNITSKLIVKSNSVPLSNGKAGTSGSYIVVYQVTDSDGLSTSKELIVIVNDPPKLNVSDRNFFRNQTVDINELIKKVKATDLEDGNILPKVKIIKIESNGNILNNPLSFITSELGEFKVTISVTDNYKKSSSNFFLAKVVNDIHVSSKEYKITTRFISKEFIGTLSDKSIWKSNANYYSTLISSLNRTTPIIRYKFNLNDIQRSKIYTNSHKPSSSSNNRYSEEFLHTKED